MRYRHHPGILPLLLMSGAMIVLICQRDAENWITTSRRQAFVVSETLLQPGDLIFRKGCSMVSNLVSLMDGDANYTHVGIIVEVDRNMLIVHAVPAEGANEGNLVKLEHIQDFLRPERAVDMAIYRPVREIPMGAPGQAAAYALRQAIRRTPFDGKFDLQDTSRLYCTELIWRAYLAAGIDICDARFDEMSLSNGPCILPGRLRSSPFFEPATFLFTKNHIP